MNSPLGPNEIHVYNHMLDIAFEVESDIEDAFDLPGKLVLLGLLKRITNLLEENCDKTLATGQFCVGEAVGFCSTFEEEKRCLKKDEDKDMRLEGRF